MAEQNGHKEVMQFLPKDKGSSSIGSFIIPDICSLKIDLEVI